MKTGIVLTISLALLCLPGRSSGEGRSGLERDLLHSVNEYLAETVVAVMDIQDESSSLDEDLLHSLTEYLAASVAECGTYKIVPPWDIRKLRKMEKMITGRMCLAPECQLKLADHLGAGMYVSATITREADTCTVAAALDDVRRQTQLIAARAKGSCSEAGLVKSIEDVAYFFILWGGCKPDVEGVPEVTEDLYQEAEEAGARRPVLRQPHELPELEEINGVKGSVSDVLVSVGWTVQERELDRPFYGSKVGPGIRMDGRLFMHSFFDIPVLRDLGIAAMYNASAQTGFDIENYERSEEGSTTQWRFELLYRLSYNDVVTRPAFLFQLGYGGTTCELTGPTMVVKDAGYRYPYIGVESHFMPYEPYLRLWVSGAFLFGVQPKEDVRHGSYLGLRLSAGLDVVPADSFYVGIGYEILNFYDVMLSWDDRGSTDTYVAFFLRAGCAIH